MNLDQVLGKIFLLNLRNTDHPSVTNTSIFQWPFNEWPPTSEHVQDEVQQEAGADRLGQLQVIILIFYHPQSSSTCTYGFCLSSACSAPSPSSWPCSSPTSLVRFPGLLGNSWQAGNVTTTSPTRSMMKSMEDTLENSTASSLPPCSPSSSTSSSSRSSTRPSYGSLPCTTQHSCMPSTR